MKPTDTKPNTGAPEKEVLYRKTLASIGWLELLGALAARAASEPGKAECLDPVLFEGPESCNRALDETAEMVALFALGDPPPAAAIKDVSRLVETARANGVPEPLEMVAVMDVLSAANQAGSYYKAHPEARLLNEWADALDEARDLRRALARSVDRDGSILDTASPELSSLRKKYKALKERIHRRLSEIVSRAGGDSPLQDSYYTQRGQRYVIPVKASERKRFDGIVHDTSASGQTVYVEPAELVEPNNRVRLIEAEIEAEIQRILRELAASIAEKGDVILADQRSLTQLDAVRARARLALDLKAGRPVMNGEGIMDLKKARHPLLTLRGIEVVPNDVKLGGDVKVLLVSGPNAGGKTVSLTMVGLFSLMGRAGMFVPAEDGARLAVFKDLFSVIGDGQDISQDLSSFSSRMKDMIGIYRAAGPGSLVLFDEIMSTTDPEEGSALAASILSALMEKGAVVMATTHFPALKSYAHERKGFMNAGFSFDPDNLTPSYRVVPGVPGRSLGIEVAARLGLPAPLVERSRSMVDGSKQDMESLLAELSRRLEKADEERTELEAERRSVERLAEDYRELRKRAMAREKEFNSRVQAGIRQAVTSAEEELNAIIDGIKERGGSVQDALDGRRRLKEVRESAISSFSEKDSGERPDWNKISKGAKVRVAPLGMEAEIVEKPKGKVLDSTEVKVKMGNLKVKVQAGKIRLAPAKRPAEVRDILHKKPKKKREPAPGKTPSGDAVYSEYARTSSPVLPPTSSNSLDLRGMRVHEAETEVDSFLDQCCRRNMPNVFVIHGHGTGALKQFVRELLADSPYVEEYRPGQKGEGGDGVTMVVLKELGGT